ncbi:MAG: hypothetical protein CMJ20_06605 [Phycisphaeraceae bacterium]|nr:hypothetical protein [Phycisphaeraceae bacterium]|tara:strand:- start:879 stop:1703 length:825 start_codon:yes stop_codon:yes gene_type:complete
MHPFESLEIPDGAIGLHWFGQSSFAIKSSSGIMILIDPFFPHERPAHTFIHPQSPLDESTLPADWVLLTHNHGDHTCIESIARIDAGPKNTRYMGAPESAAEITHSGIPPDRVHTITAGQSLPIDNLTIHAVWSKPPGGNPGAGIKAPDIQHLGFVVALGDIRVYISGDPINNFADHEQLTEPIRSLQPQLGLLTTHPNEGEFPFFKGSAEMAVKLGLQTAVPAHYDCFVERNYDPHDWAKHFKHTACQPMIIPYNGSATYRPTRNCALQTPYS